MADEIDDLTFPNAVITRLMNEAVWPRSGQEIFLIFFPSRSWRNQSRSPRKLELLCHALHSPSSCTSAQRRNAPAEHLVLRSIVQSSRANQNASNAKRKTVTVQDITKALQTNQFEMLVEPLQEALKGKPVSKWSLRCCLLFQARQSSSEKLVGL